jgi:transcriptional regulator GlxA family with amidase domain
MNRIGLAATILASGALAGCESVDTPKARHIEGQANVAIVIMNDLFITEATAPFDVYKHTGEDANVYFVAQSMDPITTYEGAHIYPDYTFDDAPQPDILVVPSGNHSMDTDLQNDAYIGYIRTAAADAVYVTSHCWGAFALAKAGLLDGRRATTFPGYFDELRTAFPAIGEVVEDARWVEDGNIITSNGGLAAFEASLHVVETWLGAERADEVAAGLVYADQNVAYSRDPQITSVPGTDQERPDVPDVTNIGIVIFPGLFITEAAAPFDIYEHAGDKTNVYFVAATSDPVTTYEHARIQPDYTFADAPQADVLVVPSGNHSRDTDLDDTALIDFVTTQAAGATYVTSHCWGAFTLAQAGLLDGRSATTFPGYTDELGETFPNVTAVDDARVVRDGNVITSNGGLAAYEGSLYVIDDLYGDIEAEAIAAGLVLSDENYTNAIDTRIVQ